MFGRQPHVSSLESRKRLLVAESEINRARLCQEWQLMTESVHGLADRTRSFKTIVSSIIPLVVGLAAFTNGRPEIAAAKSSWFQKAVKGARIASTIWLMFRSRGSDSGKE